LYLLMIAHFIQWRVSGSTVSPIEPSETMYTLQNGAVNAGFIFFTLAILATIIVGRFICGWGCHIVALQDFCAWLMKMFGLAVLFAPRSIRIMSAPSGTVLNYSTQSTLAAVPRCRVDHRPVGWRASYAPRCDSL
jgi:hypothetical protein